MNKLEKINETIFESIKHFDENGNEYWYARELQKVLEYNKWENFEKVIEKAKLSCLNSNYGLQDHFPDVRKTLFGFRFVLTVKHLRRRFDHFCNHRI